MGMYQDDTNNHLEAFNTTLDNILEDIAHKWKPGATQRWFEEREKRDPITGEVVASGYTRGNLLALCRLPQGEFMVDFVKRALFNMIYERGRLITEIALAQDSMGAGKAPIGWRLVVEDPEVFKRLDAFCGAARAALDDKLGASRLSRRDPNAGLKRLVESLAPLDQAFDDRILWTCPESLIVACETRFADQKAEREASKSHDENAWD